MTCILKRKVSLKEIGYVDILPLDTFWTRMLSLHKYWTIRFQNWTLTQFAKEVVAMVQFHRLPMPFWMSWNRPAQGMHQKIRILNFHRICSGSRNSHNDPFLSQKVLSTQIVMSSSPNATAVAEAFPDLFPKAAKNKTQKKLEFKACSSEDSNFEKLLGMGIIMNMICRKFY